MKSIWRHVALAVAISAAACTAGQDESPGSEAAPEEAPAEASTASADADFLKSMSDHHQGMIAMARTATEQATNQEVKDEARRMSAKQEAEQQQMLGMLQGSYQATHEPRLSPSNQAMADSLQQKSGADFDMAFRMNVVQHHQEGIQMIDEMLPRLTDPEVRGMAEMMKTDQQREIGELQAKMGH